MKTTTDQTEGAEMPVPFHTVDLAALRTLSTSRLERRLALQRECLAPLRYRAAIKIVLDERANLDHIVSPEA